jgi:hypothetical protein
MPSNTHSKLKIRLEVMREQDGKIRVRPFADELLIPNPTQLTVKQLRNAALVIEIRTDQLQLETTWDDIHVPKPKIEIK